MKVSVEVEGEERLEHDVRVIRRNLDASIRRVAPQLSEVTFSAVRAQYASNGTRGPRGKRWTRKRETIDRYTAMNRRGFSVLNENMRATDRLFISETTRGGPHGILRVKDDELTQGTDLNYGLIHQRRGQTQYDPTDQDVKRYASIIRRGIVKDADKFFDYVDSGEIPF